MGRPTTKTDLINTAEANYAQLNALIADLGEKELSTPFAFDDKKKEWNSRKKGECAKWCRQHM